MAYVTYAERRGLEQGRSEAAKVFRETLNAILATKSAMITEQLESVDEKLAKIADLDVLKDLSVLALKDDNLNQFHARLEEVYKETINS